MAAAGDGSKRPHGELISEASGARPRTPRRGDQVAIVTTDPTGSPDMRLHNDAARAALAAYNSGAADSDGAAPVVGLDTPVPPGGSGVTGSGNTWADTSSLGR
jgi:hypothetical protein